jgi:hypothetical protein
MVDRVGEVDAVATSKEGSILCTDALNCRKRALRNEYIVGGYGARSGAS